ncbi:hypothetical protein M2161_005050 [Streptomyces sp. SAI-133]|nr:hypothetical protein [Streptomyces sp. SAI-133]MDH6585944.1 hypothetical protein [Streptomyces sp. SAI-133]
MSETAGCLVGGPRRARWTRAASAMTLAVGGLARRASRYDQNPSGTDA